MRLLFITRTFPPLVGGMEKFANDFYENYRKLGDIDIIANSGGKKAIVFFFIKVVVFLAFRSKKYDVIHIYDAVLSPLTLFVKVFSKAKVSITVNGLDIVYSRFGYQKIILPFIKMADRIIAISQFTQQRCVFRGISNDNITVIPVGLDFDQSDIYTETMKSAIISKFNIPVDGKKILITVGRLVKRKGHIWFIANVMIDLPSEYIYLIVGQGPEQDRIKNIVNDLELNERVYLLGQVSEEEKNCLYQISSLFVMPNISIKNDQEGFGIVSLEAGKYGLPVIASKIEGIIDAVIDGKTGRLIDEKNAIGFKNAIIGNNIDRSLVNESANSNFNWKNIIWRYQNEFEKMVAE